MKKLAKSAILVSLALLTIGCNSDDSTVDPPVIEKTYYLSRITQTFYDDEDVDSNQIQIRETPPLEKFLFRTIFAFNYDANFEINNIAYSSYSFNDGNITQDQLFDVSHTLDTQGRLEAFEIKEGTTVLEQFLYQYENEVLKTSTYNLPTQGIAVTSSYGYNAKNQMNLQTAPEANLLIDYNYNALGQINYFKINGQGLQATYDDKRTPFYNLPFDLTSLLIEFKNVFPLSYHFPNNITSFQMGDEIGEIEYFYNEANLPTKAIYYETTKEEGEVAFDIQYYYTIKETVIKP